MPVTLVKTDWVDGNLNFRDASGNIIATWDGTNRKLSFPSGSTLEVLGTATIVDKALAAGDVALAEGSIIVGDSAGKGAALSAKTSGRILVGDGTTVASVALGTDATLAASGALTIANGVVTLAKMANMSTDRLIGRDTAAAGVPEEISVTNGLAFTGSGGIGISAGGVTAAMLANGAGVAALFTAGAGASAAYAKTTNGAQVLATGTAGTKKVFIFVTVTEAFADAGGNQPTFTIGEVGTADKFSAAALLTNATLNTVKVLAGELTASTNLIVTGVPAVGAGTGAISVAAIILPATT